ncbi:polysaccharide deacetylase family protein [Candidatus Parcubacteria bacterium]|nr:polysaccharide deacetylase family protein [Candidatus Parcubacteria bacterium]
MHARPLLVFGVMCIALSGATLLFSRYVNIQESTVNSPTSNPLLYAEITASSSPDMPLVLPKEILLPILVYHVVRPSYPSDSAAIRAIALTPENFNAEMKYLGDAGYHVVRFGDLEAYFASGTPLPSKPIILSFDDGWSDQFKYAFPILERYHYPVTFFVFTNAIGHRGFLTWDQLRQLIQAGMNIGDHTRSHPYLTTITSTSTLLNEIVGSRQLLEQKLGVPVNEFAYPFGLYNAHIIELVKEAGYKSARGDYYHEGQSLNHLFDLPALNAPTTLALFKQRFP